MGFKAVRAARVPLGLEGLDDEDVVADELENDVLQRRFKMILTIDLLLSMLIDKEQMERLLRNIANMFWIKLGASRFRSDDAEMRSLLSFF